MVRNELTSAKDIEDISFDILKGSKALGVFPTPIDQIVQYAELRVNEKRDLTIIHRNYFGKSTKLLKKALRKVMGALDRREKTIYLDLIQYPSRKKFITLHETGHDLLPWQKKLYEYIEDDEYSIDPETKETFEAEASYFASATLFQLDRFEEKLKQLPLALKSAMTLADEFGSSKHAAIRRYVECSNRRCALLVLKDFNKANKNAVLRNYFQSSNFTSDFGDLTWPETLNVDMPFIEDMIYNKRFHENGTIICKDQNNGLMNFKYHFFNNNYNTFILMMPVGEKNKSRTRIIVNTN